MVALVALLALCWGSFLNVVAYRLIHDQSWGGRSLCPHCKKSIAWFDNIPVLSFFLLHGQCRLCKKSISKLYPFIEIITAYSIALLYTTVDPSYFWGYAFFFSALIVTIRTDLETMLISRYATIMLMPIGILASFADIIPITPLNSIMGAAVGYCSLWIVATIFYLITGKEGMGHGDFDLLSFIGAFTGMIGIWASLFIGSIVGTIGGIAYCIIKRKPLANTPLPFGPFLAGSAMIYVIIQQIIESIFLG